VAVARDHVTLAGLAVLLLGLLIAVARARDRARSKRLASTWAHLLSPAGTEVLDYLVLAIEEHRVGLEVLSRATIARDSARLRTAVEVVEGFAPGLEEGLSAVRQMARVVSVLVPLPAVAPALWKARGLRGAAAAAIVLHAVLVGAAERARLRAWLLARALRICVASLHRSSSELDAGGGEWPSVEIALQDLAAVGDETEVTYRRIVRALDAVGGFA
jgi:hypothetical protein